MFLPRQKGVPKEFYSAPRPTAIDVMSGLEDKFSSTTCNTSMQNMHMGGCLSAISQILTEGISVQPVHGGTCM